MKKIGVLGGTFNPVHQGHLYLAEEYQKLFQFDRILMIPTKVPPHKRAVDLAADEDRLRMCQIAAKRYPYLEVSDIELRREGKSYTYDTLTELKEIYPDSEFYLLMGSDMFLTFFNWYRAQEMLKMAVLLTAAREEDLCRTLKREKERIEAAGGRAFVLDIPVLEISSTEIRRRLQNGEETDALLDFNVFSYIRDHRLYTKEPAIPISEEELCALLQSRLKPERFRHSLGVAAMAEHYAEKYGYDKKIAKMTGLLHDICKNDNLEIQLQTIKNGAIILTDMEQSSPPLYHAIAGAAYLKAELGVTDSDIRNAVRYHTTGRAGMSLLEKIIFTADLTSAERDYPDVGIVRRLAEERLDSAVLYALEFLLCDLVKKKQYLHPDTVAAYNELRRWEKQRTE